MLRECFVRLIAGGRLASPDERLSGGVRNDWQPMTTTDNATEPTEWNAGLVTIYISPGHDYWGRNGAGRLQHGMRTPDEVEAVAGAGLRGDRYFNERPGGKGQVTFFEAEVAAAVRKDFRLPKLPGSVFRRNLMVSGVRLREWLGRRFMFQGVEFEGAQECRPCDWMDRAVAPGVEAFLRKDFRGGLRARVMRGGTLRVTNPSDEIR